MAICSLTEEEIVTFLVDGAKAEGEISPRCVVMTRQQSKNSIARTVRFALIVTSNNTALIDALIHKCLEKDEELYFVGSEVNLQTDLEIDYVYFEAKVYAKKKV